MATAPKTKAKTSAKAKKADTAKTDTPKTEAAKPESTSSEASSASDTSADTSSGASDSDSGGSKKSSTSSRPISYFSSVSTDDYRSGWDGIFSSGGKKTNGKAAKAKPAGTKRNSQLPLTLTLDADDLDPETRDLLEDALRKQAKKKRLNYDKLSGNGQVSWQISCRISPA